MVYGYARCSTNETKQDIKRQKRDLLAMGVPDEEHIYWEYEKGSKEDRAEFNKLLSIIKEGDTIATTEVPRLSRSTKQLCDVIQMVQDKHLQLLIGGFSVDCRKEDMDVMTKGMLMMWAVFAEMERDIISERVKSGMANAKAKGKKIGRPTVTIDNLPNEFIKHYPLYVTKEINVSELARLCDCSRGTIYNYLNLIERKKKQTNEFDWDNPQMIICRECHLKDKDPKLCHAVEPPMEKPFIPTDTSSCRFVRESYWQRIPQEQRDEITDEIARRSEKYWNK